MQFLKIEEKLTTDVTKDEADRGDREAGCDSGSQDGESASGNGGRRSCAGYNEAEEESCETLNGHGPPELEAASLYRHRRFLFYRFRVVLFERRDPR